MPYSLKTKTLDRNNIVTNFIKTLKIVHIKTPLKSNQSKNKTSSSVALATFPALNGHVWLVATILESAHTEHFHHCRNVLSDKGFPGYSVVICLPMKETRVPSLGREDPLEKGMTTHPSILAWRIPWTEKPGGLQSLGLQSGMTK